MPDKIQNPASVEPPWGAELDIVTIVLSPVGVFEIAPEISLVPVSAVPARMMVELAPDVTALKFPDKSNEPLCAVMVVVAPCKFHVLFDDALLAPVYQRTGVCPPPKPVVIRDPAPRALFWPAFASELKFT